jgi:hypothetical protein
VNARTDARMRMRRKRRRRRRRRRRVGRNAGRVRVLNTPPAGSSESPGCLISTAKQSAVMVKVTLSGSFFLAITSIVICEGDWYHWRGTSTGPFFAQRELLLSLKPPNVPHKRC